MLVTRQKVLRRFWYATVPVSSLDGGPQAFTLLGEPIVLFLDSKDGQPACLEDRCCHRTAKLSKGWIKDGNIVCGYHGWEYDRNGKLVNIPQFPFEQPVPDAKARELLREGALRLRLGGAGRAAWPTSPTSRRPTTPATAASTSSTTAGAPPRCG